jgi:hypothetical protein
MVVVDGDDDTHLHLLPFFLQEVSEAYENEKHQLVQRTFSILHSHSDRGNLSWILIRMCQWQQQQRSLWSALFCIIFSRECLIHNEIDQESISPIFYEQLLNLQTPKVQKFNDDLTVFFSLVESLHEKAAREMLVKSTHDAHSLD